jgi:hypothetical protein
MIQNLLSWIISQIAQKNNSNYMLKLHTIITSFLMVITLTTSIVGNATNNTEAGKLKTKGEQNQLADVQPDGRKKLKQKISLGFSPPLWGELT